MSTGIAERYAEVRERVRAACRRAGRRPTDVRIVAIAKTFPADVVKEAIAAGIEEIGENRVQELVRKASLVGEGAQWHFVGSLQKNKAKDVVGVATLVHSVDRFDVAEVLARRARDLGVVQEVLVQVNVSGEATKHGVDPARALDLAERAGSLHGLVVKGLMTLPPLASDPNESRPHFRLLAELSKGLVLRVPHATELSMGMTADFEVAVEEGATIVRVGEAIFGPRRP